MSVTINSVNQNIQITRGDSCSFVLRDGDTKEPKVFDPADTIRLTVKTQIEGTQLFQKTVTPDPAGHILISIEPADTNGVAFGEYVYDIEWTDSADKKHTIVPRSGRTRYIPIFEVCGEVTLP